MTEISGYVEIPSDHLKIACKKYLANRQKNIDDRREELIQKKMNSWIFKSKTRENAIECLKKKVDLLGMSVWDNAANKGRYWADKVKDLQDAACLAPNVLVEANMASLLKPYFSEEHVTNE